MKNLLHSRFLLLFSLLFLSLVSYGQSTNDCNITISKNADALRISGLNQPHVIYKLWKTDDGWTSIYECSQDCNTTETTTNLALGNYLVQVQMFDANWQPVCSSEQTVLIDGTSDTDDDDNTELCGGISIATTSSSISVSGLDAPHINYKLWNTDNGWSSIYFCNTCNTTETSSNLPLGNYLVQIQLFDQNWQPLDCVIEETITLTEGDDDNVNTADLELSNLVLNNTSIHPGEVLYYTFDLGNGGNTNINTNFSIKAYISTDPTLSEDDIQDGTIPTANYNAGFTQTNITGASTIPQQLNSGNYFLILKADADNQITELDEDNNILALPFTVNQVDNPLPDLSVSLLTLDENDKTNTTFPLLNYSFTMSNNSNQKVEDIILARQYISTDEYLSNDDIEGKWRTFTSINAQHSDLYDNYFEIPDSLAPGNYYLILKIDADENLAESNENNNITISSFTISSPFINDKDCSFTSYLPSGINTITSNYYTPSIAEDENGYNICFRDSYGSNARLNLDLDGNYINHYTEEPREEINYGDTYVTGRALGGTGKFEIKKCSSLDSSILWIDTFSVSSGISEGSGSSMIHPLEEGIAVFLRYFNLGPGREYSSSLLLLTHEGDSIKRIDLPPSLFAVTDSPAMKIGNAYIYVPLGYVYRGVGEIYSGLQKFSFDPNEGDWFSYQSQRDKVVIRRGNYVYYQSSTNILGTNQFYLKKINIQTGERDYGKNLNLMIGNITGVADPSEWSISSNASGRLIDATNTKDGGSLISLSSSVLGEPTGIYIIKLDSQGEVEWYKNYPDTSPLIAFETSTGGALVMEKMDSNSSSPQKIERLTSNGEVNPQCDGSDILCGDVQISTDANNISVSSLDEPHVIYKLWKIDNGWTSIYQCNGNCNVTETSNDLPLGNYLIQIQSFDESWNQICSIEEEITITEYAAGNRSSSTDSNRENFKVFPNPASSIATVFLQSPKQAGSIQLANFQGTVLQEIKLHPSQQEYQFDLNNLTAGSYMIIVLEENKKAVSRPLSISRL